MLSTYDKYIGDGIYASYDGYHIILDLRGQDDTTRIVLEPSVFNALIAYREWLIDQHRELKAPTHEQ